MARNGEVMVTGLAALVVGAGLGFGAGKISNVDTDPAPRSSEIVIVDGREMTRADLDRLVDDEVSDAKRAVARQWESNLPDGVTPNGAHRDTFGLPMNKNAYNMPAPAPSAAGATGSATTLAQHTTQLASSYNFFSSLQGRRKIRVTIPEGDLMCRLRQPGVAGRTGRPGKRNQPPQQQQFGGVEWKIFEYVPDVLTEYHMAHNKIAPQAVVTLRDNNVDATNIAQAFVETYRSLMMAEFKKRKESPEWNRYRQSNSAYAGDSIASDGSEITSWHFDKSDLYADLTTAVQDKANQILRTAGIKKGNDGKTYVTATVDGRTFAIGLAAQIKAEPGIIPYDPDLNKSTTVPVGGKTRSGSRAGSPPRARVNIPTQTNDSYVACDTSGNCQYK